MEHPEVIARWHAYVESKDPALLDAMLAEDAVFMSPAVHSPQKGRAITAKYLRAAMTVLNNGSFRYANQWFGENSAVLEFEVEVDGLQVNGVDIIGWNEAGIITTFKVMIRPFKALNAVIGHMAKQLQVA